MVLLPVPCSASSAVLERSSCAFAYGIVASPSNNDAASLALNVKSLIISSNSDVLGCHSSFLNRHGKSRQRSYLLKFRADSAKRTVSAVNFDLFDLARRAPSFLASSTIFQGDSKKDLQSVSENGQEHKNIKFNLDPLKSRQLSLPKWKQNLGQYLESSSSSFDAPPKTPVPPFTGGLISLLGLMLVCGVLLDKWTWRSPRKVQPLNAGSMQREGLGPQFSSTGIAMFLRRDLRTKESVEWVNMVLGKLWKVYRFGLESWLVGLLQPLIDNLEKPAYVERVQIKQFYLGDEPISVRSVQRRASRRSNDLQFLTKLLVEDLPRLFVLPKKISMDFLKGRAHEPVPKGFKGATLDGNKGFSGELSVTLLDARKLIYVPYGKSDPYVLLTLGDQVMKSKRNSQTSVFGPLGSPIWNQNFQFLVVDPKSQRLIVHVRDYFAITAITIGIAEVDLSGLQDTVPVDRVVRLRGHWGPFEKRFVGELLLQLTYTAYVEEDEDEEKVEGTPYSSTNGYLTEADENDADAVPLFKEVVNKAVESAEEEKPLSNVFAAVIAELNKESILDNSMAERGSSGVASEGQGSKNNGKMGGLVADEAERLETRTGLLLLALMTGLVVLVDISINFSNFLNP